MEIFLKPRSVGRKSCFSVGLGPEQQSKSATFFKKSYLDEENTNQNDGMDRMISTTLSIRNFEHVCAEVHTVCQSMQSFLQKSAFLK